MLLESKVYGYCRQATVVDFYSYVKWMFILMSF